jgi:hypothetical protein
MVNTNWGSTTVSVGATTSLYTYSYTPVSSNSELHITLNGHQVWVGGSGSDGWYSIGIFVDSSHVSHRARLFTGDRVHNPLDGTLTGNYVNSNTNAKVIKIEGSAQSNSNTNDPMETSSDGFTYLTITEVSR